MMAVTTAALLVVAPLVVAAPMPPAVAATTVCIEIVVDYGQLAQQGAPAGASATCVTVPGGSSGAEVLAERARKLGRPAPRWENGMLCAIDGYPRTGCAESDPAGGYDYWSYWRAVDDGPWTYSNRGAAAGIPDDGHHHAEGWAWVQGGAEGSRKPAHVSYASVCPVAPATPKPPATSGAAQPAPAHVAARKITQTTGPVARTVVTGSAAPTRTRQPSPSPSATPTASPSAGGTSTPSVAEPPRDTGGGTGPLAPIAGAALVAGLGAAAVVRHRRSP